MLGQHRALTQHDTTLYREFGFNAQGFINSIPIPMIRVVPPLALRCAVCAILFWIHLRKSAATSGANGSPAWDVESVMLETYIKNSENCEA